MLQQIGVALHIILLYFFPPFGTVKDMVVDGKLLQQIGVALPYNSIIFLPPVRDGERHGGILEQGGGPKKLQKSSKIIKNQ